MPRSNDKASLSGGEEATHREYLRPERPGEEVHSARTATGGTARAPASLHGSVTAKSEPVAEETSLLAVALPSVSRHLVREKTVAKWGILRRRVVRELRTAWEEACSSAGTPAFALDVDAFVGQLTKWMPEFRSVPYEETFSGIMQLLRDATTGKAYVRMRDEGLHEAVLDVLSMPHLNAEGALNFSVYNDAHTRLLERGLVG